MAFERAGEAVGDGFGVAGAAEEGGDAGLGAGREEVGEVQAEDVGLGDVRGNEGEDGTAGADPGCQWAAIRSRVCAAGSAGWERVRIIERVWNGRRQTVYDSKPVGRWMGSWIGDTSAELAV
jgi:hypothetical protein